MSRWGVHVPDLVAGVRACPCLNSTLGNPVYSAKARGNGRPHPRPPCARTVSTNLRFAEVRSDIGPPPSRTMDPTSIRGSNTAPYEYWARRRRINSLRTFRSRNSYQRVRACILSRPHVALVVLSRIPMCSSSAAIFSTRTVGFMTRGKRFQSFRDSRGGADGSNAARRCRSRAGVLVVS